MATPSKTTTPRDLAPAQGTPLRRFPVEETPGKEFPRGIRPVVSGISLTPIRKRRTKISLSPVKTPKQASALKHHASMDFGKSAQTMTDETAHTAVIDVPTSGLEFEEFSFRGPDGCLKPGNLTKEQNQALREYLFNEYNLLSIDYCFPFIVLSCTGDAPAEDNRPFTIAGAIAIWLSEDDGNFLPTFGDFAGGDNINIDDEITSMMKRLTRPPQKVIEFFTLELFPDCIGLAVIYDTIVIELPKTYHDSFAERLQTLPGGIWKMPFRLRYRNGPMPNSERRARAIKPQPEIEAEQVADETDYVQLDGKFYPGTMIQSQPFDQTDINGNPIRASSQVTTGILVEKDDEKRLTCSYHNWEKLVEKTPGLFGLSTPEAKEKFRVFQGEPGTDVGYVRERMGDTDVALAQLNSDMSFENKFMEIEGEPKKLVHSGDCKAGDLYIIDSFAVGKQSLVGLGWRFIKRVGRRGDFFHEKDKPIDLTIGPQLHQTYVALEQGIYATTSKFMRRMPHIRDRVCGSVLLRAKTLDDDDEEIDVLHEGGICGMLHYADLQLKHVEKADYYLCYADVFDSLIDDGWEVAK
ncbi:hypothetical protein LZ30DRAFT_736184 [Colletotrichum cereale]|nr:hypothetical protein LZ30DRAFT_736184 [Colletotrichum cereale]